MGADVQAREQGDPLGMNSDLGNNPSDSDDDSSQDDDELPEHAQGLLGSWAPHMFGLPTGPYVDVQAVPALANQVAMEPMYRAGPNGESWPVVMPQPTWPQVLPTVPAPESCMQLVSCKQLVCAEGADPTKRDRREEKKHYRKRKTQYHTELSKKISELERMNSNLLSLKNELETMEASKEAGGKPQQQDPGQMDNLITVATDMIQANQALPMNSMAVAPNLSHSSPIFRTTWHQYVPHELRTDGKPVLQKQTESFRMIKSSSGCDPVLDPVT